MPRRKPRADDLGDLLTARRAKTSARRAVFLSNKPAADDLLGTSGLDHGRRAELARLPKGSAFAKMRRRPQSPSTAHHLRESFHDATVRFSSALVFALALARISAAAEPPNIVFIFTDDHAYQAVSAYGSGLNKTPNIDRLANEGVRFDRCYVTNSICGPSRACILTGKYSHKNGFYTNREQVRRLATDVPEAAAAGRLPDGDHRQVASDAATRRGSTTGRSCRAKDATTAREFRHARGPQTTEPGYVTDVITDKALDWLATSATPNGPSC